MLSGYNISVSSLFFILRRRESYISISRLLRRKYWLISIWISLTYRIPINLTTVSSMEWSLHPGRESFITVSEMRWLLWRDDRLYLPPADYGNVTQYNLPHTVGIWRPRILLSTGLVGEREWNEEGTLFISQNGNIMEACLEQPSREHQSGDETLIQRPCEYSKGKWVSSLLQTAHVRWSHSFVSQLECEENERLTLCMLKIQSSAPLTFEKMGETLQKSE